jgi:hypothetical protein
MPRYFFHVEDDRRTLDQQGIELPDMETARREAPNRYSRCGFPRPRADEYLPRETSGLSTASKRKA